MRSTLYSKEKDTAERAQSLQIMEGTFKSHAFEARARSVVPSRNELHELSLTQKPNKFFKKKTSDQIRVN